MLKRGASQTLQFPLICDQRQTPVRLKAYFSLFSPYINCRGGRKENSWRGGKKIEGNVEEKRSRGIGTEAKERRGYVCRFVCLFFCLNKKTRRWKPLYLAQSFLAFPHLMQLFNMLLYHDIFLYLYNFLYYVNEMKKQTLLPIFFASVLNIHSSR